MKRLINSASDISSDNSELQHAIDLINEYIWSEYGEDEEELTINDDLTDIGLMYTEDGDENQVPLQVSVNLKDPTMYVYVFDELRHTDKYSSLKELIDTDLENLYFDDLYSYARSFATEEDYNS